jgi:hypothetical protein
MKRTLNDNEIEAPQLLNGITLDDESDQEDKKRKQKSQLDRKTKQQDLILDKFEE